MKTLQISVIVAMLALAGCSTAPRPGNYECELDENRTGKCASVEQAYKASRNMNGKASAGVQSVFDRQQPEGQGDSSPSKQPVPVVGAQLSDYPDVGEQGKPVFQQPKVLRVWVAPYVDADGNLRSGEYTYFSTPGHWNYGTLKKPGAAAGAMLEPARPDNLGFKAAPAARSTTKTSEPPKPAESTATPPATPATPITQPYQRLGAN